jgi:hypothetical protein
MRRGYVSFLRGDESVRVRGARLWPHKSGRFKARLLIVTGGVLRMCAESSKGEKTGRSPLVRSSGKRAHAIADCVYGALPCTILYYPLEMCTGPRRQFQLHAPHPRLLRDNYYAITAPFGFNQIFVIEELEPPVWAFGTPFANAKTARRHSPNNVGDSFDYIPIGTARNNGVYLRL